MTQGEPPRREPGRIARYATWVFPHMNGHPRDADLDADEAETSVPDVCQGALDVPKIAAGSHPWVRRCRPRVAGAGPLGRVARLSYGDEPLNQPRRP